MTTDFDALLRVLTRMGWGGGLKSGLRRLEPPRWPATYNHDAAFRSLGQRAALRWYDIGLNCLRRKWQPLRCNHLGSAGLFAMVLRQVGRLASGSGPIRH